METIRNYLENMFKGMPKNSKVNDAKNELLTMMEDRYNELIAEGKTDNEAVGVVISQFGNLDEVSEVLGIKAEVSDKSTVKTIDLETAKEYISVTEMAASKISLGVMLCIFSGGLFVGMQSLVSYEILKDNIATIIALPIFFILIAIAVYIFITSGGALEKFDWMKKEDFDISYDTKVFTQKYRDNLFFYKGLAMNVIMIILAVIPITVVSELTNNEGHTLVAVFVLISIVAIAVRGIINACMKFETTQVLFQEEEYSPQAKKSSGLINNIAAVYFPATFAIYLVWSFVSKRWDFTWIIWPVAGILFGIISSIITNSRNNN